MILGKEKFVYLHEIVNTQHGVVVVNIQVGLCIDRETFEVRLGVQVL